MTTKAEGWREALKVIASAWSVAFIGLFLLFAATTKKYFDDGYAIDTLICFIGAVTGSGWLIYRSKSKKGLWS